LDFRVLSITFAALGGEGDAVQDMAEISRSIYNLILLGYSRKDEYEADRLGVLYAYKAGFNPYASLEALKKLKGNSKFNIKTLEYLRSHPYTDRRIEALKAFIPSLMEKSLGFSGFRAQEAVGM